jgi:hypothetical protein
MDDNSGVGFERDTTEDAAAGGLTFTHNTRRVSLLSAGVMTERMRKGLTRETLSELKAYGKRPALHSPEVNQQTTGKNRVRPTWPTCC